MNHPRPPHAIVHPDVAPALPDKGSPSPTKKPNKRDKIFSRSNDLREDRSTRQMKTAQQPSRR